MINNYALNFIVLVTVSFVSPVVKSEDLPINKFVKSLNSAADAIANKPYATKLTKEKGILEPKESLQWNSDLKSISKDWIKADNKYFSVFYPKCFSIEMDGQGEGDYKTSQGISLKRKSECAGYSENWNESNWLNILYEFEWPAKKINLHSILLGKNILYRQKVNINTFESFIAASALDSKNNEGAGFSVQLRWQIVIICKSKVFRATYVVPPGKPSYSRVENNDYQVPDDFKQIISTFQCNP